MAELKERNIGCGLHYSAAHEFSWYREHFGWQPEDFPEAHFVSERIVSLPLFPDMTEADRGDVVQAVYDIAKRFGR
jgi:dTDP-4-amino-4,6-dideoxygalactose transaminase